MQTYARHKGWKVGSCNILVEGTSDYEIFSIAAQRHLVATGEDLFRNGLQIVCAGHLHEGGTHGVVRELTVTRSLEKYALSSRGLPRYRFVALVDDDAAGRQAISGAQYADASVLEYRDIFRVRPKMICRGNRDLEDLRVEFERRNSAYKGLDWELEDMLRVGFVEAFCRKSPGVLRDKQEVSGRVHWEMTRKGKREIRKYVRDNAEADDLEGVVCAIRSFRFCLGFA